MAISGGMHKLFRVNVRRPKLVPGSNAVNGHQVLHHTHQATNGCWTVFLKPRRQSRALINRPFGIQLRRHIRAADHMWR